MDELDFSDVDHTLGRNAIETSWLHTYDDVYIYPLLHKGLTTDYSTSDFKPAIFHKAYLKKIAEEAGYSLGGSFMDNPIYDKEIIPFNGSLTPMLEAEKERRSFRAGSTGAVTGPHLPVVFGNFDTGVVNYTNFTDDTTLPNFDPNHHFDVSNSTWTLDNNGKYNLKGVINLQAILNVIHGAGVNGGGDITAKVGIYKNGLWLTSITPPTQTLPLQPGSTHNFYIDINKTNMQFNIGDVISFKIRFFGITRYSTTYIDAQGHPITVSTEFELNSTLGDGSYFYVEPVVTELTDDDTIALNNFIPATVKQSVIIDDIVKRYNLIIRTDPDNKKKVLLDSRDDYYATGLGNGVLDWTDKKDYSNKDTIKLISEVQSKEMSFTYTSDSDDFNEAYGALFDEEDEIYGAKKIELNNEFVSGEKKVKTPFSPTPLVYSTINGEMILPAINAIEADNNIRVLYWGGMVDCLDDGTGTLHSWEYTSIDSGVSNPQTRTTYPYAGHFDRPVNPTIDINFGVNPTYLYSEANTQATDNNLFNNYWRNTISQITEGRLVTSKYHLTEVDISYIKDNLNATIFVKDSYYHVNKIKDYNPLENGLTTVELIKIVEGVAFVPSTLVSDGTGNGNPTGEELMRLTVSDINGVSNSSKVITDKENSVQSEFTNVSGIGNRIEQHSPLTTIRGRDNTIGGKSPNASIFGDNNIINQNNERAVIMGGNNNIIDDNTTNSIIMGGNGNTISANIKNAFIIGADNKTVTEENEIWVGDLHILNGKIVSSANVVEGGINELRSSFPDNEFNLIDGGEDELRDPFPENLENLIDGGEDKL